jgi:hypothetical protein
MPKTIKVLDVIPEDNENTPINDDVDAVNEPEQVIETEVKGDEKDEELPKEQVEEKTIETAVEETKPQETKQIRTQQLHQCPKCQKWLTKKTLTYFHECTKNDTVKAKRRPKKVIVKDIEPPPPSPKPSPPPSPKPPPQPKLVRQVNHYTPPVEVSYEDMRKDRIKQRIQQRTVKIQSLFANAI